MRAKGPKCRLCGKAIPLMSYDAAYLKLVRPGEAKAIFICWKCAEKRLGDKLGELAGTSAKGERGVGGG
ncbi:MAG: hypothetical protein QXP65_02840 [Candidatus Hadarchaeales archaeon]